MAGLTPDQRARYVEDGLTVVRAVVPPSLVRDLRREADKARAIVRRDYGPQAQRLQPVARYDELDQTPFRAFKDLEPLREAVADLCGPDYVESDLLGILVEPAEHAWCTEWHRDYSRERTGPDVDDVRRFGQLNAPLYDDASFWYVPGSHLRADTAEELALFGSSMPPPPDLPEAEEERELATTAYARLMPGAEQLFLAAGDVALYRSTGWHLGRYVPYVPRATLHDWIDQRGMKEAHARTYPEKVAAAASSAGR